MTDPMPMPRQLATTTAAPKLPSSSKNEKAGDLSATCLPGDLVPTCLPRRLRILAPPGAISEDWQTVQAATAKPRRGVRIEMNGAATQPHDDHPRGPHPPRTPRSGGAVNAGSLASSGTG